MLRCWNVVSYHFLRRIVALVQYNMNYDLFDYYKQTFIDLWCFAYVQASLEIEATYRHIDKEVLSCHVARCNQVITSDMLKQITDLSFDWFDNRTSIIVYIKRCTSQFRYTVKPLYSEH